MGPGARLGVWAWGASRIPLLRMQVCPVYPDKVASTVTVSVARMLRVRFIAAAALWCLLFVSPASAAGEPTTLRLDGIGPLKLGMKVTAARQTGWLAQRGSGCPLGGPPLPVTYRLIGRRAPAGVRGVAQFDRGRLTNLSFTRGVRTVAGVTVGRTTSARMVARYRAAGFGAAAGFDSTFQGTFTTVGHGKRQLLGGFGETDVVSVLAIPSVPVCE